MTSSSCGTPSGCGRLPDRRTAVAPSSPVDLTQPLYPDMPCYPGDDLPVRFTPAVEDGHMVTALSLGTHSGTHLDAPRHFLAGGPTVGELAVSRFCGRAIVADVRVGAAGEIDAPVLERAFQAAGRPQPGEFVLLWTGWDRHFGDGEMTRFPFLGLDAARLLLDLGVSLVGVDTLSVDSFTADRFLVHEALLSAGTLIVENLCNLERLGPGPAWCCLLPLPLKDLDGSPLRAVAWR